MNAKLTLLLNKEVIARAKQFATSKDTSLSKLIEQYLLYLTEKAEDTSDISPLVASLTGLIEDPGEDYRKGYGEFLAKKHR